MNPPVSAPPRSVSTLALALMIVGGMSVVCVLLLGFVAYPAFQRYLLRAKSLEAVQRLESLYRASGTYAASLPSSGAAPRQFPISVACTPTRIPHATRVVDPAGTWDQPTWQALAFSLTGPHYFSYEYVSSGAGRGAQFTARAYGDLDGDGAIATFERSGALDANGGVFSASDRVWRSGDIE